MSMFLESSQEKNPYWEKTNLPHIQKRLNELIIESALLDNYSLLELVIAEGGNINYQDKNGNTALHRTNLSLKMQNFLLLYGAQGNIKNNDGYTRKDLLNSDLHRVDFLIDKMMLLAERIDKNMRQLRSDQTPTNSTDLHQDRFEISMTRESISMTEELSPEASGHSPCTIQ
jgi:ankyrin repeat protein